MRLTTMRHVSFLILSVVLFAMTGTVIAQETPELGAVATISDEEWTLSISFPDNWVTVSDEEGLYIANTESALAVTRALDGTLNAKETGFVLFAPGTAAALDLPTGSSAADALAAFLDERGWQSPSGDVYEGDPAVSFNLFPVQPDGNIDFGVPLIVDTGVDAFAFEREGTFIFAFFISSSDVFAIQEAMWDSLTLTRAEPAPETEGTSIAGDIVFPVDDDSRQLAFSAALPEGWQSLWDEETGVLVLASSSAALAVATGESDEYERGDSALIITLPPGLRALDINPFDSADLVFTAYAAALGIEAYPSFVEGFEVFAAQGYITGETLPGGQANLYAFGFPAGVFTVMVQDVLGASNPAVNDVLHSLQYDLPD